MFFGRIGFKMMCLYNFLLDCCISRSFFNVMAMHVYVTSYKSRLCPTSIWVVVQGPLLGLFLSSDSSVLWGPASACPHLHGEGLGGQLRGWQRAHHQVRQGQQAGGRCPQREDLLKSLSKGSQKSFKSLSKVSQKSLKSFSKVFQKSFKSRSKVAQKSLKSLSKVSQKSLKSISKVSQLVMSSLLITLINFRKGQKSLWSLFDAP